MRKILIVGTGLMAKEYFKALSQFDFEVTIVGRGELNAQRFYEEYNVKPFVGGVREYFLQNKVRFEFAIIAVGVDQLTEASIVCIENGCGKLLVEKPGGLNFDEIRNLAKTAAINNSEIYVAYNRRFYSSVMEAIRIADSDGGILSGSFEFTEWSHVIRELPVSDVIKSNYFLANSSHVFDLAFYIFGMPLRMNSYSGGDVGWHRPAIYSGAGVTESGVLFSYSAN